MEINNLISKSLLNFDILREKYHYLINDKINKPMIDSEKNKIIFTIDKNKTETFDYEVLGILDQQTKTWLWSWLIPTINQESMVISRNLLNYGLNLNTKSSTRDHLFLKTQLTNSRFVLENDVQLDLHLAICCYISKQNIKFLYPFHLQLSKNQSILIYYIIK